MMEPHEVELLAKVIKERDAALAEVGRLRLSQKIDGMALAEFNEKLDIAVNGIDAFLRQVSLQWYTDQFIKDSISSTSVQNVYNFETLQRSKQAFYELNNVLKQIRGETI